MRNVRCPQYRRCLDRTIEAGLPTWDCRACPHRHDADVITPPELVGCALLVLAVLMPDRYRTVVIEIRQDPLDR